MDEGTSVWRLSTVASGTESEWSETETCPYQTPSAQSKGSHPVRDHIKLLEQVLHSFRSSVAEVVDSQQDKNPEKDEGEPVLFPTSRMKPVTSQIDAAIDVRGSNPV